MHELKFLKSLLKLEIL